MTVSVATSASTTQGNGATTNFTFNFVYVSAADISVIYTDASGNQNTLATNLYTLALNPPASNQIWGVGGTVTYPLTGSPIATGTSLTIVRTVPLTQLISLVNQGTYYPAAIEQALDLLCMEIQEGSSSSTGAITAPVVDVNPQMVLPAAAQRANMYVAFDASGNVIAALASPGTVPISAVMIPVVEALTLALARTAMGLGAAAVENLGGTIIDNGSGSLKIANSGVTAGTYFPASVTVGADGRVTSASSRGIRSYIAGLTLSTAGGSSTFGIAAGIATDSTNISLMSLASAYTKTTASWAVGSTFGALDTGVIANTTWYHVYEIQRVDTGVVDIIFSLSASSPALPTNYTLFRRIGSMLTDGSAHWVLFTQVNNEFVWAMSLADINAAGSISTSARVLAALNVPTGIVVTAKFRATLIDARGSSSSAVMLSSPDEADQSVTATTADLQANGTAGIGSAGDFARLTNTSAQIGYRSTVNSPVVTLTASAYGWTDYRGTNI